MVAAERCGWGLVPVAGGLAYAAGGISAAEGVVLGGALGLLNFRLMKVYLGRVLRRGRRPPGWMHAAYVAKFGVLALVLAAAFRYAGPHPRGVFAGFSVLVVALIWAGLSSSGPAAGRRAGRDAEKMETQG
ncbi:MAG: ATP synthase subunit I [Nitrospinota bacterium]